MRRSRRNGHSGLEFGGSGEDSFVAVVVTKLTGALLFILLLTMVIMALLPKVANLPASAERGASDEAAPPLAIATPERLPEAIAGHAYVVALAATGGQGPLRWAVDGELPAGLSFDAESAQIRGTPRAGTSRPAALVLRVSDGSDRATKTTQLVVYQSDRPLSTPSKWKPALPPIPWQAWLEQGVGFLILWLVHLVGMNTLGSLLRSRLAALPADSTEAVDDERALRRRFTVYRSLVRLATLTATAALAAWLLRPH
jgi:hypothetical protein